MNKKYKKWFKESFILLCLLSIGVAFYGLSIKNPLIVEASRYTLTPTTQSLLKQFDKPIKLDLYTQEVELYHQAETLIKRYQFIQPQIQFQWHPQSFIGRQVSSVMMVSYGEQQESIDLSHSLKEYQLTQALFKLQRKHNQWVVFLQGHQEPDPFSKENKDFQLLRMALQNQGLKIQRLNLALTPVIPHNTQVLIVASPKSQLLPTEQQLILDYVKKGGNLLWLIDPNSVAIPALSEYLGVQPLAGTIVDLHGQKLGTPHPAITIIDQYPDLPFAMPKTLSAFPWAVALQQTARPLWQTQPILQTNEATWTETQSLNGDIAFNPEQQEVSGPLLLGIGLTRWQGQETQRVTVIGNSRFLSNGAIENYGNLALGLNIVNWLAHDDILVQVEQPMIKDAFLHIHLATALWIKYGLALLNLLALLILLIFFYRRSALSNKITTQHMQDRSF